MGLLPFLNRNRHDQPIDLQKRASEIFAKKEVLGQAVMVLLQCVRELSLDLTEIGSEDLKERMDELGRIVRADELSAALGPAFQDGQEEVLAYADRARDYLAERESELKRIVAVLTSGMKSMSQGNDRFNSGVQHQAARLDQISQLGDIRQLRKELSQEVVQLKQSVVEKRRVDTEQVSSLHKEVEKLRGAVDQARSDALRDALTGAGNRLAFDQRLQLLVERNEVRPTPFSLLLIDVDHFKKINDTYGHPIGDRVLVALVQTCRGQFRSDDFVGRYGGEEFVILVPGATGRVALKKAKKLCKVQSRMAYAVDESVQVRFNVTIGVTDYRKGDTAESILARADTSLYTGKNGGRNRAVLAD